MKVGQLHFVCFPTTFQKLFISLKVSSGKVWETVTVGQLQFNIFQKIGANEKNLGYKRQKQTKIESFIKI